MKITGNDQIILNLKCTYDCSNIKDICNSYKAFTTQSDVIANSSNGIWSEIQINNEFFSCNL